MKRVLMIAFHYPPLRGSSGIQRTLKFSRYLPEYGWQPLILTANSKAYAQVGDELLGTRPLARPARKYSTGFPVRLAIKARVSFDGLERPCSTR